MSDIVNKNQAAAELAQIAKTKDDTKERQKDRSSSARDRLLNKLKDAKSSDNVGSSSRYQELLSNNQKALSGRVKRLSPTGKSSAFTGSPEHQGAMRKSPVSPSSAKGKLEQRSDMRLTQ